VLSFDLSGKDGPTSSYATAGLALWIIALRKPPYLAKDAFVKVEILQGEIYEKCGLDINLNKTKYLCIGEKHSNLNLD
jgi:hypothetical protein